MFSVITAKLSLTCYLLKTKSKKQSVTKFYTSYIHISYKPTCWVNHYQVESQPLNYFGMLASRLVDGKLAFASSVCVLRN